MTSGGVAAADGTSVAVSGNAAAAGQLQLQLGSKTLPFIQPGCHMMFLPDRWCLPVPSQFVKGCCTPGYSCNRDYGSITGYSCQPVQKQQLSYSFDQSKGVCNQLVDINHQCGGAGFDCYKYATCDQFGPWLGFCCPNGYTCQPTNRQFRRWTCQVDVQDQPPGASLCSICTAAVQLQLGTWSRNNSSCCTAKTAGCSTRHGHQVIYFTACSPLSASTSHGKNHQASVCN